MSEPTPLFVGLDVQKDCVVVSHARGPSIDPPVFVGDSRRAAGCMGYRVNRLIGPWLSSEQHVITM